MTNELHYLRPAMSCQQPRHEGMHARGDADGIRALLHALTKALSDLDAAPADRTVQLAAQLRTSLDKR